MAQARALGSEARAAAEASSREAAALEARGKELAEVPPPTSSALTSFQSTQPCDLWPCIRSGLFMVRVCFLPGPQHC